MLSTPSNEPIYSYAPNTPEREKLSEALQSIYDKVIDIPMVINGKEVSTDKKIDICPPHNHKHVIGKCSYGNASHVKEAIDAALAAKTDWAFMSLEERSAIFLKAADLMAGKYRYDVNAATMAGQSKNAYQAEIDTPCELVDFIRFNVAFAKDIVSYQPISTDGVKNSMDYRPLEGFVFAVTPFNFSAIAGNLPFAPALMGNTVVWKPTESQIYAAYLTMKIFQEAGVPDGVINLVYCDGPEAGEVVFNHKDFAGIHFTGSTKTFKHIWKTISNNIDLYKTFPRIVGETGGKDFVLAHPSADAKKVATGLVRGAFEYQGQKCSAASRAYIPASLWEDVKNYVVEDLKTFKVGPPDDFSNFINAVIDEKAYDKITEAIRNAQNCHTCEIVAGGTFDKSVGYFIDPTVIKTEDPHYASMVEEIFGPVLTVYVYEDDKFEDVLTLVDESTPYALTGAIFSNDRDAIELTSKRLVNAAGNFYINDKPTGAVVGQQPFGGARMSGTNDKAGAPNNLWRWISPRTVKETMNPATDYRYPFLGE